MKPSEALELHRGAIVEVLARYPVTDPRVYGSVARGEDTEESDLDILVKRGANLGYVDLFKLEDELAELTGVKVDVRTEGEFRPLMLERVSRDFRPL